jgi:hypothetical protein
MSRLFYDTGNAAGSDGSTSSIGWTRTLGYAHGAGATPKNLGGKCVTAASGTDGTGTMPTATNNYAPRYIVCPCFRDAAVEFGADFTTGVTPSAAVAADWGYFKTSLARALSDGRVFTRVTLRGSKDPVGKTCTGAAAQSLATSLSTGATNNGVACTTGGTWSTSGIYGISAETSSGNCTNPSYVVRPQIGNANWGGINGATCSPPSQRMEVLFDN